MKRVARHITAGIAVLSALFAVSCISPHQSAATDIEVQPWCCATTVTQANTDTTSLRDIHLFLCCNNRFREDTLTVQITVRTPDALRFEESFRLSIPRNNTPASRKREVVIPYRHCVRLLRSGNYHLTITPQRPVEGVEAVGFSIVKQ